MHPAPLRELTDEEIEDISSIYFSHSNVGGSMLCMRAIDVMLFARAILAKAREEK
jgi:hypothetical protein